ncbi:MAG: hypothetical protein WBJ84_05870 [Bacteroidales bacterium]
MKKVTLSLIVVLSVLANVLYAQEKTEGVSDKKGEVVAPSTSMQTFMLAGQLAKYGYENNSASALIQAAELYLSIGMTELTPESYAQGKGTETKKDDVVSHDPKQILSDAKKLAADDKTLLAMIDRLENAKKSRGAVGGAKYATHRVDARSTDSFKIRFYGNETATVIVSGDGDTDLDLYVYDENDNLVGQDNDYSDDCVVTWTPRWTGSFTIKVVNRGYVYNRYIIATN